MFSKSLNEMSADPLFAGLAYQKEKQKKENIRNIVFRMRITV